MYKELRSTGALSYDKVEQMFEEHQAKWPEAIFNEDAYYKYLQPLINDGSGAYLPMLQGSKAEQRKWQLYNRFRYIDSKYNAGDALTDVIQLRGYAKSNVTVTPYADIYPAVKYGSYLVSTRGQRLVATTLTCPLDNVNDTEIYIYSASQLADIGDLSGLMVGFADLSMATRLQNLKIGDSSSSYSNGNMTVLTLGNNTLLQTIDVRNCPNLTQSVDLSGCTGLQEVYFGGTSITGCTLANGGRVKTLQLPSTLTNLTLRNQTQLTTLEVPSYANISTLRLENVGSGVNPYAILQQIAVNSRVRIIGMTLTMTTDEVEQFYDYLDTMRGLDENGNNTDKVQIECTITGLGNITGTWLSEMQARYPAITLEYDHITSYLYYYNYDGSSLLYTETILDGGDGTYSGQPSRDATAASTFTFAGWNRYTNQYTADANATKAVTADRKVYAAYTATGRKYTVYFYNGNTLLQTVNNVPYGSSAAYTGTTPIYTGSNPEDYEFTGWSPTPTNIQGNTSCYAQYRYTALTDTITDSWAAIFTAIDDGTYSTKYSVGDTKILTLGVGGTVCMQIAAFDTDNKADGSGKAPITQISQQLLASSQRMNPSLVTNYNESTKKTWITDTSADYAQKTNNQGNSSTTANASWSISATTAGTLTVSYKVGSEANYDKLTVTVNGTTVANAISGNVDQTDYTVDCSAGDTVTVTGAYFKDGSGDSNGDTGYIKFSSTGTIEITASISDLTIKTVRDYQESTGAIGGQEKSELRSYLKNTAMPSIPDEVRTRIVSVTKTQSSYNTAGSSVTQTTTDDVQIPSYNEIFGSSSAYYGLFQNTNANRIKYKAGATGVTQWWLRSARYTYGFNYVGSDGSSGSRDANYSSGVALGFCT